MLRIYCHYFYNVMLNYFTLYPKPLNDYIYIQLVKILLTGSHDITSCIVNNIKRKSKLNGKDVKSSSPDIKY